MSFGDAYALRALFGALSRQNQLQSLYIQLQSCEHVSNVYDDIDSEDEPECFETEPYSDQDKIARLFEPVWESVYRLLEHGMRGDLR